MGVLNKSQIRDLISVTDYAKKLLITPLLTEDQIGPASVDIRLGSSIIVPRRTFVGTHDVTDFHKVRQVEGRLYDRIRLKYHSEFVLHPNQVILAATLEYLSLPYSVYCQVASRSSWGRLGLVVATAAIVQPGFKGCLTLELVNLSDSPMTLYPGLLVGQLVFMSVDAGGEKAVYEGRYDCPTEAGPPEFFTKQIDKEMRFWGHDGKEDIR